MIYADAGPRIQITCINDTQFLEWHYKVGLFMHIINVDKNIYMICMFDMKVFLYSFAFDFYFLLTEVILNRTFLLNLVNIFIKFLLNYFNLLSEKLCMRLKTISADFVILLFYVHLT